MIGHWRLPGGRPFFVQFLSGGIFSVSFTTMCPYKVDQDLLPEMSALTWINENTHTAIPNNQHFFTNVSWFWETQCSNRR